MSDAELELLSRRARLETVWELYPEEISAAIAAAAQAAAGLNLPHESSAEPWPYVPATCR